MLAAAEHPLLLAQRGIDVHALLAITWAIAVSSAALAGILYSLGNHLEGGIAVIGLKAFPAALVGGLGSLSGVLPGALLVALAEVAAIQFVSPQLSNVAPFLVLLGALLVRPWGLFGVPEQIDRV
jgi:branched-chain amino acid transport system permease protein